MRDVHVSPSVRAVATDSLTIYPAYGNRSARGPCGASCSAGAALDEESVDSMGRSPASSVAAFYAGTIQDVRGAQRKYHGAGELYMSPLRRSVDPSNP